MNRPQAQRFEDQVVDYARAPCQISKDFGLEHMLQTVKGVAMKDSAPGQDPVGNSPAVAPGASRRHLRAIKSPSPAQCSDEDAHELPTQNISHDVGPDDPPPTMLSW